MIIGYNTDVEHGGVVYHVQTEDKGLDTPIVLSLIYSGGAILASKRTPYDDLIASGFDNSKLLERLNRQHRVICAAIRAGRIDDLRKLSGRGPVREAEPTDQEAFDETTLSPEDHFENLEVPPVLPDAAAELEALPEGSPDTVATPEPRSPATEPAPFDERPTTAGDVRPRDGLRIDLTGESGEFRSGEMVDLKIAVANVVQGTERPAPSVSVSIKVLGTSFRPIIRSMKTDENGIAAISGQIPVFTSGRAAILIRATDGGLSSEIRRVIHPSV